MKIVAEKLEKEYLTPKEFRQLTQWSVYKMARFSEIPIGTMYCYLKDATDPYYREPKPYIKKLFALIYELNIHRA